MSFVDSVDYQKSMFPLDSIDKILQKIPNRCKKSLSLDDRKIHHFGKDLEHMDYFLQQHIFKTSYFENKNFLATFVTSTWGVILRSPPLYALL